MNATAETLAAIYKIAKHFIFADGEATDDEIKPLFEFFGTFPSVDMELLGKIMEAGDNMDDHTAVNHVKALDADGKQQMADLFARIVCADGELTEDEKALYFKIQELCDLPDPQDGEEEEDEESGQVPASGPAAPEEDEEEDDSIVPAYIVANFYGIASVRQSENENWSELEPELSEWIGTEGGVQIVRYTQALNQISQQLRLNGRHLVFMVARNGYGNKTVGDNMTATILYGGGYPIYGNIVFALETDKGYEIEGFLTKSLLNEAFGAINDAVGGLLRVQE